MIVVGQPVEHGHRGVCGKVEDGLMLERARLDHVDHAADNPRGITDVLALAEMDLAGPEIESVAAELRHGHLEGDPRARRRLLEDHAQRGSGEKLGAGAGLVRLLEQAGQLDDTKQLRLGEILRIDEMPQRRWHSSVLR
jgi:hypothetical protein